MQPVEYTIEIATPSVANTRENRHAKARRTRTQRRTARLVTGCYAPKKPCAYIVNLCRVGRRMLDTDNLASSLKAIRDGIADALGIDDGPKSGTEWEYTQETARSPKPVCVRVTICEKEFSR